MDYKKILKSQSSRFAILKALSWIPDSIMLRLQYRIKVGRWPNLKHPTRFTEKLQLYKMKYRNPLMFQCVDKYEVREYIKTKGLGDTLVPLIGVYDDARDIPFEDLPNRFVLKTTDGGGGRAVLVVKDKKNIDWNTRKDEINGWKNVKDVNPGREWAYTGIKKSRFIVEEFIDSGATMLTDYKFFCFNGEPQYLYVVTERTPGVSAKIGVYDIKFNKLPVSRCDEERQEYAVSKPENYEEMVKVTRQLSADFPHVRVDLYNVRGKIYFGELTFYDGSGYFNYEPDEFDKQMGSYFTEY